MLIPFSATFVLEVNAPVSLKVATKGSFRGKKNPEKFVFLRLFFKAETNLECSYLVQLHTFWK